MGSINIIKLLQSQLIILSSAFANFKLKSIVLRSVTKRMTSYIHLNVGTSWLRDAAF